MYPLRRDLLTFLQPAVGGNDSLAGWGVDWPSGEAVGSWYAANDVTLVKLVHAYVTVTHDTAFLGERVTSGTSLRATAPGGAPGSVPGATGATVEGPTAEGPAAVAPTVWQQLLGLATAWQGRVGTAGGLADFGGPPNLLECVPTYVHKVAAFNAAAVWSSRMVGRAADHPSLEQERVRPNPNPNPNPPLHAPAAPLLAPGRPPSPDLESIPWDPLGRAPHPPTRHPPATQQRPTSRPSPVLLPHLTPPPASLVPRLVVAPHAAATHPPPPSTPSGGGGCVGYRGRRGARGPRQAVRALELRPELRPQISAHLAPRSRAEISS